MNSSLIDMNEVCAYKLIQLRQYSGYTLSLILLSGFITHV